MITKTLIVAPVSYDCFKELISELVIKKEVDLSECTLLSTKNYRYDEINDYIDVQCERLEDSVPINMSCFSQVIVCQYSPAIVCYMNVYRFLRSNNINEIKVKTKSQNLEEVQLCNLLTYCENQDKGQEAIYYVSPKNIKNCVPYSNLDFGKVLGGDWDLDTFSFDEIPFYQSLRERVEHGTDWEQLPYYKQLLNGLSKGKVANFGCETKEEIKARCRKLDDLFEDIKLNGWKQLAGEDYITINIGRHGEVLFADGRHRLSIAKVLGLPKIPVKISVRHKKWQDFKNAVATYQEQMYGGKYIYAPIDHIDLVEFKGANDDSRYHIIADNIDTRGSRILDIGSHWGGVCNFLEKQGHLCTAIEYDPSSYYFLEKIKEIQQNHFQSHCMSIFDFVTEECYFDVIVALNIFHHFLKERKYFDELTRILPLIKAKKMFLQTHATSEKQMENSFINFSGEEFVDYIIDNSCFTRGVELANYQETGRKLYLLTC